MKTLDLVQNTPEWEEFRRSHVGASDIGILMEGSEREIYDLLQEKRGLSKKFVTDAMRRGSDMEAEAVEWLVGHPPGDKTTALHDEHPWLMASFDYLDLKSERLVEVKCPKVVLDTAKEHSNFRKWYWQVQTQIELSRLSFGTILIYSPVKQVVEHIERNDEDIKKLIAKGKWFHDLLVNFDELPAPSEAQVRDDDEAFEWAAEFGRIDAQIKALEEEKKVLRDEGIAIANDVPFVCNGVKVLKITSKETIDYEAACKANNIDVSQFKKVPKTPYSWRVQAS